MAGSNQTKRRPGSQGGGAGGVPTSGNSNISGVKTFTTADSPVVVDEAYGAGWDGDLSVPTKNAVYDKIQAVGLLAAAYYNPSSGTVTKTFTTSVVAMDTTNLRATFAAPPSGNVVVKVGGGRLTPNNSNPHFAILDGATTKGTQFLTAAVQLVTHQSASFYVTGLTPATSYSYDFAVVDTNLTTASTLQYGYTTSNLADGTGAAYIEVWAAP